MKRRRNTRVSGEAIALTPEQFEEVQRCASDPIYFLTRYGFILDPVRGHIHFELYEYQETTLEEFLVNPYNIVLKSRQMGLSWLVAGFALWLAQFHSNKNVLMISIKEGTAKRLLDKVKYIYDYQPDWMKVVMSDDNKTLVTFNHGSRIESIPTSEEAGRSEGVSLLVIDESAHVRWIEQIWQAAEPTLSTGGMCVLLSTPNGIGNFFHKTWINAKAGTNGFNGIYLPWWINPVFGANKKKKKMRMAGGKIVKRWVSPWYLSRIKRLNDMRKVAQEIDCEFLSSGANFFDTATVSARFKKAIDPSKVKYVSRWNDELRIFSRPKPDHVYVLGMDTATGHGEDYSSVSVREFSTWNQVATYRTQLPISVFASKVDELARYYNNAFVVGEENGVSIATLLQLRDTHHYPDDLIYKDVNVDSEERREYIGWSNNKKSRHVFLREYEKVVRESPRTFKDSRLLAELLVFVVKPNGKCEAMEGYTDDLIFADLCCLIGLLHYQPVGDLPFKVA